MFLKFGHTARPLEALKEINVWYQEDVRLKHVEGTTVKKKHPKLKLRIEFSDGSAWSFDLPDEIDREELLKRFLREVNKRVITDVPEVVNGLIKKMEVRCHGENRGT